MKLLAITLWMAINTLRCTASETVTVESRKADGALNAPSWTELSGKWGRSKNKTRVTDASSLLATNVSVCVTNMPVPAFKISPDLEANTSYQVAVTFGTSSTYAASPDLTVAVSTAGVSASTIPTNTPVFQGTRADGWNILGTITTSTNHPMLTFTYVSGTLSRESRWYADTIRFIPELSDKTSNAEPITK